MSAYASLPGSLLPFFAFGAPTPSPTTCGDAARPRAQTPTTTTTTSVPDEYGSSTSSVAAPPSSSYRSGSAVGRPSAFTALALSPPPPPPPPPPPGVGDIAVDPEGITPPSTSCRRRPSDIVIAFQSARVDPVALLRSLTSTGSDIARRGSSIARRTANFIVASQRETTPPGDAQDNDSADKGVSSGENISHQEDPENISHQEDTDDAAGAAARNEAGVVSSKNSHHEDTIDAKVGGSDVVSYSYAFSRPGLCYDDSDDSDDEYSMYDYSDDFSTPNDDDDDSHDYYGGNRPHHQHDGDDEANYGGRGLGEGGGDNDPSAIEFELSITFQGRRYNATRAFPTFVKLRNDLLREVGAEGGNDRRRIRRGIGSGGSGRGGAKGPAIVTNDFAPEQRSPSLLPREEESVVPELPVVSPHSLGHHGGGPSALTGVARSGFALLQATAQHYCPEMERWMRHVIDAFPCSQSLSSFLWEPLSSSSDAGWGGTIGEGNEESNNGGGGFYDGGVANGKEGEGYPLSDASSSASAKPPMHSRRKHRSTNNLLSKSSWYKSKGSMGSLDSIDEGDGNDWDDHSFRILQHIPSPPPTHTPLQKESPTQPAN